MEEEEQLIKTLWGIAGAALLAAVVMTVAVMLGGCSSRPRVEYLTKENTVEVRDTVFREREVVRVDSVVVNREVASYRRDSIAPILDSLNRMIGIERWHFEKVTESSEAERMRYEAAMDSLKAVASEVAIVREPYPVEVEKEVNRLRWWQKGLMWIGGIVLLISPYWLILRRK